MHLLVIRTEASDLEYALLLPGVIEMALTFSLFKSKT